MPKILTATSCNLDADILGACLPLLEAAKVDALEWSFDALFRVKDIPEWFVDLLDFYSQAGRLTGHGVFFSLFSGKWLPAQEEWLRHLQQTSRRFPFDHVTEHFGFMTGKDFHNGAPLNIPFTASTLAIGQDRLKRIQAACECPVGLENLAFSYSVEEVRQHGDFLHQLLEPVNGFIILDLHNLYCQMHNFNISYDEIIGLYPLEKVREIHISGGSWDDVPDLPGRIRRDTHDDAVPGAVFELLEATIPRCSRLKYVVLEQIGTGLSSAESRLAFYQDFLKMEQIISTHQPVETNPHELCFLPGTTSVSDTPPEDMALFAQQQELANILENAPDYATAWDLLQQSSLVSSEWQIEQWKPYMLETARKIAQKWK